MISDDDTIYVATSYPGFLYALSTNGTLKWKWSTSATLFQPAITKDGTVLVPAMYGANQGTNGLYAFHPDGTPKWNFKSGFVGSQTQVTIGLDDTIYFSVADKFYSLTPEGALQWSQNWSAARVIIREDGTILVSYYIPGYGTFLASVEWDGIADWSISAGQSQNFALGPSGLIVMDSSLFTLDGVQFGSGLPGGAPAFTVDNTYYTIH